MKTKGELRKTLHELDHKGYGSYKILKGQYDFGEFTLLIDHVQGDPFASPSRVRVQVRNEGRLKKEYYAYRFRKTAAEDYLLRLFHKNLLESAGRKQGTGFSEKPGNAFHGKQGTAFRGKEEKCGTGFGQRMGSGKSGLITTCRTGQEVLERTALLISDELFELRLEIGFPAFGRSIAAAQLEEILYQKLPVLVRKTFYELDSHKKELLSAIGLSDNQEYIRQELRKRGLVCFVGDGSILPRESGVSEKPLRSAVPFKAPETMAITMELPFSGTEGDLPEWKQTENGFAPCSSHTKTLRGMGISKGITLIVGGGYHGKSTLLKAIERGVYPHIEQDGREYVLTDVSAVKLRAEEGRSICQEDISLFISNLPNKADTIHFSTENASGSTSQAANTVEAVAAGSRLFLIDEDTTATNFMVRDERMAALVSKEKEPISPFIQHIRGLYEQAGISTILVVGSSGDFFAAADKVIQMDEYRIKDVTKKAKELAGEKNIENLSIGNKLERKDEKSGCRDSAKTSDGKLDYSNTLKTDFLLHCRPARKTIEKIRVHDWDELSLNKTEIDLRYMEQIVDSGQTAAMGYLLQYAFEKLADGKKSPVQIVEEVFDKIERKGFVSLIPQNYGSGAPVLPRKQELLGCLLRYRGLR